MSLNRCQDYRKIRKLIKRPLIVSNEVYYLVESGDRGVWTFQPIMDGLVVHADMGPMCRGRAAVRSAREAFAWVFKNTNYDKIYADIPNDNRAAQMVAVWAGMEFVTSGGGHRGYTIGA